MEIQHQAKQRKSDSSDSWEPQQCNFIEGQNKPSLFQKITIEYGDQTIQNNVDIECQKPILNSQLFPFKDQENDEQIDLQQTHEEQFKNTMSESKNNEPTINEIKSNKSTKNTFKPMQNQEALFNVIQDQQNQHWMRKKLKYGIQQTSKSLRPLTCPQCFTQICYVYEVTKATSKAQPQKYISDGKNTFSNQKTYKAKVVDNVQILQHKIIRNRFSSQNMQKTPNFIDKQYEQETGTKRLEKYQKNLRQRYQDINVKILISCKECGLDLGYWDANQQMYQLFNVI